MPADEANSLEELADDDQATGDPTELLELLEDLRARPLDVNRATAVELAQIPALGPLLAERIVRYRTENSPFDSLPNLQLIEGITEEVYAQARPYLTIGQPLPARAPRPSEFPPVPRLSEVAAGLRYTATQRFQRRLDLSEGFTEADTARAFAGSPERVYTRLQAQYRRNVSVNVTLEKDPGEAFGFDDNRLGYDYASGHAALLRVGRVDALIAGDFVAEFGQGLLLWRAAGFGKGPDATRGPLRTGRGLRPYGSVDENRFFRGLAATVAVTPRLYASAFASRRRLDASLVAPDSLDLDEDGLPIGDADFVVEGLPADGFHRTATERARKDALGESLFGGAVEYRLDGPTLGGRAGVVGYRARFDDPLQPRERPDVRFDFAGQEATAVSAYFDARTRALQAFGEAARAPGGAIGLLGGLLAEVGSDAEALVVVRRFPRDFSTLHGYPFGERNGVGQNEEGFYVGARVRPGGAWTVAAYLDQYRFPWLRFNVPRPSAGREALVYVEHRPRRWLRAYLQARTETREVGADVPNDVPPSVVGGLARETRRSLRLQAEYEASRAVRFRARVEGVRFTSEEDTLPALGALLFQDVRWQARRWLRLDARLTFFDTDGFDARLYQLESDVTGVFALPVFSGRGTRAYALATVTPVERLSIQAKLAATWFEDVRRISSGLNEIPGSRVRDFGLQVRYTF